MAGGPSLTLSIFSIPPWLVAEATLLLALLVLVREHISPVSIAFAALAGSVGLWMIGGGFAYSSTLRADAIMWERIAFVGITAIAPSVYLFTTLVLRIFRQHRRFILLAVAISAIFAALDLFTDLVIPDVYSYSWGYFTHFAPWAIPFLLLLFAILLYCLFLLRAAYNEAVTRTARQRIGRLMLALGVGCLSGVDGLAALGIPVYPFGYVLIMGFVAILAVAVRSYHLTDITPAFAADEIIDTMNEALLLMSPNGTIRSANRAAGELFDVSRDALIGRKIADLVPEPPLPTQLNQLLQLGRVRDYELSYTALDGAQRTFSISASVMHDAAGEPVAIVCSAQDISEYKRVAERAQHQTAYLAALHETSLGLLRRLDLADLLEAITLRAAMLVGTTHGYIYVHAPDADELVVTTGIGIFRQNIGFRLKRGEGLAGRVWETGEPLTVNDYRSWIGRSTALDPFGFRAVAGVPITSEGKVVGVIGLAYIEPGRTFGPVELDVLNRFAQLASIALANAQLYDAAQRDLAERRRAEEEVRRLNESLEGRVAERTAALEAANRDLQNEVAERQRAEEERARLLVLEQQARASAEEAVRAREVMLSVVSHDLRNPLSAIKGSIALLRRLSDRARREDDEKLRAGLTRIDSAANKMNLLIDELLDFARLQAGQKLDLALRATDLVTLVRQVVAAHQFYANTHQINVSSSATTLVGIWDALRIERVLDNLIGNAIKYSPEGSQIDVTMSREETEGGAWALLVVHDPGIGIPAADLPYVFDWFHRASNVTGRIKGTGIGLPSARWVIEQHGGTIDVASEEGSGTTFTVRLRLATRPAGTRITAG